MPYELRTFGGLDLRDPDGASVEPMLSHSKGMALLAYLAAEGRASPVSRSELAAVLWPDRDEKRAQNALRITLTRIRQDGDPGLVEGKHASHVRPNSELVAVDLWAFDDAIERGDVDRALELYRGDFLAGVRVGAVAPFQRWADERRERYRDAAYEAALTAGRNARQTDDREAATAAFERALELRPLREEAVAMLIQTLAERGRVAEALQRFERFRERRRRELEMAPSGQLEQLVDEVRAGEKAVGKPGVESAEEIAWKSEASPSSRPSTATEPTGRTLRSKRRRAIGAVFVLLAAAAVTFWRMGEPGARGTAASQEPSVAVLPFEAIGGDPWSISEGLHTDLLTRLSHVSGITVISGTSVNRFRDADLTLPAIADSLGARWVIEGAVQRVRGGIEVNVQLIDPSTDTHAWAESYRRALTATDLFDLQSEISGRVAGELATRVAVEEEDRMGGRPTGSLEAHRLYIRGRGLLEQRSVDQMERSLDYFHRALTLDSAYALAWAGRADALSLLARRFSQFDPDTLLPPARRAADRALEIDPDLAEAHAARARLAMYRREGPEALRSLERAIELRPSYAAAHAWLAKLQLSLGRPEEALQSAERAVQLDPLSTENQGTLVFTLRANGDQKRALEVSRRITNLGHGEGASSYELRSLAHLSRLEEMRAAMQERGWSDTMGPVPALMVAEAGGAVPFEAVLRSFDSAEYPLVAATIHAADGDLERALALMHQDYPREDWPWDYWSTVFIRYEAFWPNTLGTLREDPRFDALIREMNRQWGLRLDGSLPETAGVRLTES